jgi:8-amino-3,8-dideoxy-alpha-D-manno-octulosonate transaminase
MRRRTFLGSVGALLGAGAAARALAIDGGKPVRATPLRSTFTGTEYYDDLEVRELRDVIVARQPFRWYGPGSTPPMKVLSFERALAARMQSKYTLAVTSGTAALITALAALEVGPGDEVILPALSWYSCFNAIVLQGALPVFAEIDESLNIDPSDFERKITPQTKAVMVVHALGCPCDMDSILSIARQRGVKVLEDAAQSVGASYHGKPVASIGDIGIFSFQLAKTITSGEGGAVLTDDPALFERASRYHDLGLLRPPHEKLLGGAHLSGVSGNQYRMSEVIGGVLGAQLKKLDTIVAAMREHARRVYEGIADLPGLRLRSRPDPEGDIGRSLYLSFSSRELRDRFLAAMKAENVPASSPLGVALMPLQPYIVQKKTTHPAWPSFTSERGREMRYGAECCPRTVDIHGRSAGLTIDPKFTREDVNDIIAAIRKVHPVIVNA